MIPHPPSFYESNNIVTLSSSLLRKGLFTDFGTLPTEYSYVYPMLENTLSTTCRYRTTKKCPYHLQVIAK